jgi:hypothetical protein
MKLEIDNQNIGGVSTKNSLIQIPEPSNLLPGYYSFQIGHGTVSVTNKGPYQAWITANSRIIMESLDGSNAYASWISNFIDNNNKVVQDSSLLPVDSTTTFTFANPCKNNPGVPGQGSNCITAPNTYRMYVYLNGYDQKGDLFLGTQYFGPVKVTP